MSDITDHQAQKVLRAALTKARDDGFSMAIAIVDRTSYLKAFARMDGTRLGPVDVAMRKARTAMLFETDTGSFGERAKAGGPIQSIELSNGGLSLLKGGLPLRNRRGETIGAIGVSGSSGENDLLVAEAGAAALS
jgi:uncharacterized protein GlcG (DUF336 family)